MSKGITQQQWLNIVIIIISALILAFTLIGRFMEKAVEESDARQLQIKDDDQQISVPVVQLTSIDFGTLRMTLNQQKSHSEGLVWSVEPKGSLPQKQMKLLLERWQQILIMNAEPLEQQVSRKYISVATVLLYFAESARPIIAKVMVSDKIEPTATIKIRFVSTGQQVIVDKLPLDQILPRQALQKLMDEKTHQVPLILKD